VYFIIDSCYTKIQSTQSKLQGAYAEANNKTRIIKKMNLTPDKLAQISAQLGAAKKEQDKLSAETKAAARAAKTSEKESARALKAAERAEKAAQKAQNKASKSSAARVPNYMQKIEKLRGRLPEASSSVLEITSRFADSSFTDADLTTIGVHLGFEQRRRGILASAEPSNKVRVGDVVEIQNCVNRKFIGTQGVVEKVRRIRAFVRVDGHDLPAYTFVSDLKVLKSSENRVGGTNILDLSEEDDIELYEEVSTGT
jgi:multidrug efflux pump subunit AcrA (membrane-fusion protein)